MAIKTVAVIGAGPSGLITLDSLLREKKFEVVRLFERRDKAGGCWIYDPSPPESLPKISDLAAKKADPTDKIPANLPCYTSKSTKQRFMDTACYSYLESNVDGSVMEFSEEPFPEQATELSISKYGKSTPFRHNSLVRQWVENLYKSKGYDDHIEFNTSVELVTKVGEKWEVTLRRPGKSQDYWWVEKFDAVVVASGHFDVPYVPDFEGLQEFHDRYPDSVIHTKAYRSKDYYRNKRVVVVGGSVSAMDAVRDIVDVVKGPVHSSRRTNSKPHAYFGDVAFNHPSVKSHSEIANIDPETRTVYFQDGSSVKNVDNIIFGTGFAFSLPFLPHIKLTENGVPLNYLHVFNNQDPTLAFVGGIQAGLTFMVFEWQAVLVARFFAQRTQLPSIEERQKWIQDRIQVRGDGFKFITLFPDFQEYFESVRLLAGNEGPGRKLPLFNPNWVKTFERGHQRRIKYWIENSQTLQTSRL